MLMLRAFASFLTCPAVVAGLIPLLLTRGYPMSPRSLGFALPVLGLGAAALLWCVRDFYLPGRGTLAPWDPPRRLVAVGLYRVTRNPMYWSVLTILLGWSLLYRSWMLVGYFAMIAVGFHVRVVCFEEPQLRKRFGEDWEKYAARVPRWARSLGRKSEP